MLCPHIEHQIAEREFYTNQKNKYSGTRIICLECGENIFIKDAEYGVYSKISNMGTVKLQDVYLEIKESEKLSETVFALQNDDYYGKVEKHTGMVVLTKEQYLENIKDAMNYMCTPREYLDRIKESLK